MQEDKKIVEDLGALIKLVKFCKDERKYRMGDQSYNPCLECNFTELCKTIKLEA